MRIRNLASSAIYHGLTIHRFGSKGLKCADLVVWLLLILPSLARGFYVNISSNLIFNAPWTIGEWLINYAGGFTRRGAPGFLIYHASIITGAPPWIIAVGVSVASWIFLAILLFVVCRRIFRSVFIFSPFALLAPLIGEYLVRKDCFNLALLGISVVVAKRAKRGKGFSRKHIIVMNILGIFAILSHESYIFYAFPTLLLVLFDSDSIFFPRTMRRDLPCCLKLLCPMTIISVLCFCFHGNGQVAESIQQSWLLLSGQFPPEYPSDPMGAIGAIGWSSSYAFNYTNKSIIFELANGFVWRPIALLFTLFILLMIVSSRFAIRRDYSLFSCKVKTIFIAISVSMLPIFIIGHDYGRWLFMITVSTMFASACVSSRLDFSRDCSALQVMGSKTGVLATIFSIAPFFFGIPPYWNSWNLAWAAQSSWIGYLALPISEFVRIRFFVLYLISFLLIGGFVWCWQLALHD